MHWVSRGSKKYLYESIRLPDGRIRKVYLGRGDDAQRAAQVHAEAQQRLAAQRAEVVQLEQQLALIDGLDTELAEGLGELTTAALLVGGCYKHKGEWRHEKAQAREAST